MQTRWYQSLAVKNNIVTFIATHVPLLGLIAFLVLFPDKLSAWGVFGTALAFTLVATGVVIFTQWQMFRPLRAAADGLQGFMSRGVLFRESPNTSDEMGRLISILVSSLAHIDRGRNPLLSSGAVALGEAQADVGILNPGEFVWLALAEIDEPQMLDGHHGMPALIKLHEAIFRASNLMLVDGEMALPWGRGRMLMLLKGKPQDVRKRLETFCRRIDAKEGEAFTASAALEPEGKDDLARAAALQRLEHKLFTIRVRGDEATVLS